jgi:hypothetical protein
MLNEIVDEVMEITQSHSVHELNAKIGGKYQQLANIKERCIRSEDEFLSLYFDGLRQKIRSIHPSTRQGSGYYRLAKWYQDEKLFRKYTDNFLRRTFLRYVSAQV